MSKSKPTILKVLTRPETSPANDETVSEPDVNGVVQYSRSMFSTFWFVGIAAGALYLMQWFLAFVSSKTSESSSTPRIPYPSANIDATQVAVTLLITAAIAVQVFLRLPRDSERFTREDAVSQRQFWGPIAILIAIASAFLIPLVAVDAILSSADSGVLNTAEAIGIPLVAVLALIFASDAATIVAEEGKQEYFVQLQTKAKISELRKTAGWIKGKSRKRPTWALVGYSISIGSILVGLGTWAAWGLTEQQLLIIAYAVLSSLCTAGMVIVSAQSVPAILRGRILDSIFQVLLPVLAIVLVSLQSMILALPYIGTPKDPAAYIPPLSYGVMITIPPFATVALLAAIKLPGGRSAPLMDFARNQIEKLIEKYEQVQSTHRSDNEMWRVLSGAAILLSPIPFLSIFLSAGATWHRRHSPHQSKPLLIAGWAFSIFFAVAETLAMIFIAFYGPHLGWFKL